MQLKVEKDQNYSRKMSNKLLRSVCQKNIAKFYKDENLKNHILSIRWPSPNI